MVEVEWYDDFKKWLFMVQLWLDFYGIPYSFLEPADFEEMWREGMGVMEVIEELDPEEEEDE